MKTAWTLFVLIAAGLAAGATPLPAQHQPPTSAALHHQQRLQLGSRASQHDVLALRDIDIAMESAPPGSPARGALFGAALGTVAAVALVFIVPCDEECRTSGAGRSGRLLAVPLYAAAGAAIGATVQLLRRR